MLEQAAEWLEHQRQSALAVPVEYLKRGGETLRLNASLGGTLFRAENEYGVTIRTESCDFLIAASALPFDPVRGDRILYQGREYEVLAPNGEPVWRWCGSYHWAKRIHTKELGSILAGASTEQAARNTGERGPQKVPEAREAGHELRERSVATFRGDY